MVRRGIFELLRRGILADSERSENEIWEATKEQDGAGKESESEFLNGGGWNGGDLFGGFDDEGLLEDLEIVIERNGAGSDGENDDPQQAGDVGGARNFKSGDEDVELAEKAGKRWNAGEREDEDEEADCDEGRPAAESAEIVESDFAVFSFNEADDAEDSDYRETVGEEVINGGGGAVFRLGEKRDEGVAGMGNGAIGDDPADVALGKSEEISDDHRCGRECRDDDSPTGDGVCPRGGPGMGRDSEEEKFQEEHEAGEF